MIVDLVIVIVLVLFCVRSFKAGVKGELLGAIGWIVAVIAAIGLCTPIGDVLSDKLPQIAQLSPYVSFLIIVIFFRLLIMGLIKLIPEAPKGATAVIFNILAGVLGFFKGAFFLSVVLLLISTTDFQPTIESYAEGGAVYAQIKDFAVYVVNFVVEKVPNVETILHGLS
ncbi:CvpA family protein [candidate division KSB1 bacterium]|nr:CvpA family protein [candidate division KSB1 bacterium]RQW07162.1 MAG: CvpA family protein [candidate division KSB1 bacterium]